MLSRRDFVRLCAVLGVSAPFLPACSISAKQDEQEITVETIAAAERIVGVELSAKERRQVLEGVDWCLEAYRELREEKFDSRVNPAMVFNPILPGMTFSREKRPIRYSDVTVSRPDRIEDAAFFPVLQLAKLIETQQVTSTELTEMYLARLKRYDPKLEFVINLTEELALTQARRTDEEIRSGRYRGPLHGIPYGTKDLFSVKGYKTTWGAEPFKDQVIDRDAAVVEKLEEAGAVLLAKLATGALASGEKWFGGVTKNPWNPSWLAGGSSCGPASATAAGCVGFSIGTETNGSMVSPVDGCGATGLRPTFGRVSRYGAMTTSWSFDKVTPIFRTVEDCAVVLNAICGPDGRDNSIIDLPFNWSPEFDIRTLRIGYHTKFFEKELVGNPTERAQIDYRMDVRQESENILSFFREQDINLVPLDFDILPTTGGGLEMIIETTAAFDEFSRGTQDDLMVDDKWPKYFRQARFVPAVEYVQSSRYRTTIMEEMNEVFQDVDVFLEITWANNWVTNLTGHPIVVVPCGFTRMGRPVTITFVGKLFGEAELLAVAKAYQDATDHHLKHPEWLQAQ